MTRYILYALIIVSCSALGKPPVNPVQTGNIRVIVRNFKSDEGKANVIMYKDAYTFPDKPDRSFRTIWTTIKDGVVDITFQDIPYGEYAFAAYHDINDNHRLDLSFIGIPKEGVAISNDARGLFMPRFKDAKIVLDGPVKTIEMKISY